MTCMLRSPVESYSLQIKNKVPNLVANLQGMLVGLGISGSGSIKRKETWRQQFESAPGYFCSLSLFSNSCLAHNTGLYFRFF